MMKPQITQNTQIKKENHSEFLYKDLFYKISGFGIEVHKKLVCRFLEKVYESSIMLLFERNNIKAEQYNIKFCR